MFLLFVGILTSLFAYFLVTLNVQRLNEQIKHASRRVENSDSEQQWTIKTNTLKHTTYFTWSWKLETDWHCVKETKWDWITTTVISSIRHLAINARTTIPIASANCFPIFSSIFCPKEIYKYLHQPLFITLQLQFWWLGLIWSWRASFIAHRVRTSFARKIAILLSVCLGVERNIFNIFMLFVCFFYVVWSRCLFFLVDLLLFNCLSGCITRVW